MTSNYTAKAEDLINNLCISYQKYAPCVMRLHPEMSLGAYFQYEIYTSVFAV